MYSAAVGRIRFNARVLWDLWYVQSGTRAGYLLVLLLPLQIYSPTTVLQSLIIQSSTLCSLDTYGVVKQRG
jgi:hypothetical protein